MFTVLSGLIIVLWYFFIWFILPIICILAVIIIISVIFQYRKYGKNVFSSFKVKNTKNYRDKVLYITLDKITNYKKILKLSYLASNYVLIDKNGVSLFYLFLEEGIIEGNENDKFLSHTLGSIKNRPIINPFKKLNDDYDKIKEFYPDIPIKKYLVTISNEYINVKSDTTILKYNEILYSLPNQNILTDEQVEDIYEKLTKEDVK